MRRQSAVDGSLPVQPDPYVRIERPSAPGEWPVRFRDRDDGSDAGVRAVELHPDHVVLRRHVAGIPMRAEPAARLLSGRRGAAARRGSERGRDAGAGACRSLARSHAVRGADAGRCRRRMARLGRGARPADAGDEARRHHRGRLSDAGPPGRWPHHPTPPPSRRAEAPPPDHLHAPRRDAARARPTSSIAASARSARGIECCWGPRRQHPSRPPASCRHGRSWPIGELQG